MSTARLSVAHSPSRTQPGALVNANTASAVLENPDLVAAILAHVKLCPSEFVAIGRVAKVWRDACRADARMLLAAARTPEFLTKRTLMGLFGLHWHEADKLPRGKRPRRNGGFLYMYNAASIDCALPLVGGFEGWKQRLAKRAADERAIAATARR